MADQLSSSDTTHPVSYKGAENVTHEMKKVPEAHRLLSQDRSDG